MSLNKLEQFIRLNLTDDIYDLPLCVLRIGTSAEFSGSDYIEREVNGEQWIRRSIRSTATCSRYSKRVAQLCDSIVDASMHEGVTPTILIKLIN